MGGRMWTETELDFIHENYQNMTNAEMAHHLGREKSGVQLKVNRLGLKGENGRKPRCRDTYAGNLPKVGDRFGMLTVREIVERPGYTSAICACDCQPYVTFERPVSDLKSRSNHSCNCQKFVKGVEGHSSHPLYKHWTRMKEKGLFVCQEWQDYENFYQWGINTFQSGCSLYCKDKSKGFEPSNCLWDKPHLHGDDEKYLAFGEYKTLTEWADDDRAQVAQSSLSERLKKGMSLEEALTTPPTRNNGAARNPAKIGDVYGRLTIIDGPWMEKKGHQMASKVRCRCECGKEIEVFVNSMKGEGRGKTRSCGCLKSDINRENMKKTNEAGKNSHPTHNMSRTRLYRTYYSMINRCYYEKHESYKNYGGRNISVCDEWRESFINFAEWAMKNGYDDTLSIDRIDNNGNYCPENCRFVSMKVQSNNTRFNNFIEAFGEKKTLATWVSDQRCIVDYNTLRYRIMYYGWEPKDALTIPSIRQST